MSAPWSPRQKRNVRLAARVFTAPFALVAGVVGLLIVTVITFCGAIILVLGFAFGRDPQWEWEFYKERVSKWTKEFAPWLRRRA
jgi:hypothetical protein